MEKTSHLLRQERERRGFSLQEVERELRIPVRYLEMLEGARDKRFLADPLYLIPSLRTYASFLVLDPTAAVTQFTAELQAWQKVDPRVAGPKQSFLVSKHSPQHSRVWSRLAVLGLALGVLAFVGQYEEIVTRWPWSAEGTAPLSSFEVPSLLQLWTPPAPSSLASPVSPAAPDRPDASPAPLTESPAVTTARQPESEVPAPPQPESVALDSTSQPQEAPAPALHSLRVQAKEQTWLRVTIDEQDAKEVLLRPGQVVEWSAGAGFTLTLGNAGGVELTLDGQGLPPLGESGQVIRNIHLPAHG
ncbi:MAG TPA: RodZ domain-containing protein [Candidatus Binatia bacterium]|jgi:cytoskeleton protein RodZ|nr:RodZ domain-containing protein [Candidatus Binatia bacterium]